MRVWSSATRLLRTECAHSRPRSGPRPRVCERSEQTHREFPRASARVSRPKETEGQGRQQVPDGTRTSVRRRFLSRTKKKRSFRVTILSLGRELCLGQSLSAEGHRPLREHATIHIKKQVPPYLARLKIDPVELCTHCRLGMSRLCSIYILRVMEQLVERNFPHSQNNCKFYFHLARALTKLSV